VSDGGGASSLISIPQFRDKHQVTANLIEHVLQSVLERGLRWGGDSNF